MESSLTLGRIAGIPVRLHFSWFIIATLLTLSLVLRFSNVNPNWGAVLIWSSAIGASLLFFATVIAHEMSHALVARARRVPVRAITLFALGGVTELETDTESAWTEFWIAVAGPASSALIGLVCVATAGEMGWSVEGAAPGIVAAIFGWVGSINILLAIVNLIPGYPLDGGRVLRAALWAVHGDDDRATSTAARVGLVIAGLFIAFGMVRLLGGAGLGGVWLAVVGWSLLVEARAGYEEVATTTSLRNVSTADAMNDDCRNVGASTRLDELADDATHAGGRCFLVTGDDGTVVGLITPLDVASVQPSLWRTTRVGDAMRPLEQFATVTTRTPASAVLKLMNREDLDQVPVFDKGRLAGVVSRTQLLGFVQTRGELSISSRRSASRGISGDGW